LWQQFSDAEVATVLVSHDQLPDLQEIRLRAAFASVIPADANFDQLRSAIRIGCSFAHKPHFDHKDGAPNQAALPQVAPRSVLVADDNRTNRNILAAILESAGHRVSQVCDGDEMLDALERECFDVVLLDVNMPRLNGIDACKMWRQIEGSRRHLPIIGVTADATSETEARCLAAGMDLRLTKPINSGLLLSAIEKCCSDGSVTIELPNAAEDPLQIVVPLTPLDSAGEQSAIDPAHMDYLKSIGDDIFVAGMVESFFDDIAECRATLMKSVEERDPALFRFAAHAFKSSANNIGALQLAALCGKLERVTEADFDAQRTDYVQRIENELQRATDALKLPQPNRPLNSTKRSQG
jgi:two-component system, sensor histidine kinase RpfC